MWQRVTIIGLGLIGGSVARALKKHGLATEVVGCDRDQPMLTLGLALGVIDRIETDIARGVQGADLIVIAVPVGAMSAVMRALAAVTDLTAIITDVGSAKGCVIAAAREAFGEVPARFVAGHPIAGTEKSGVEASFAELFIQRCVILTPTAETDPQALAAVTAMWRGIGAEVVEMDAHHHDEVLAATSHLPHVLAFTLVDTLAQMEERREIFRFAAGGFRDFTRIASSDPTMWRDICAANREAIVAMIDRYQQELETLKRDIHLGAHDEIEQRFTRAKQARDRFMKSFN
ncbi:MAG: prephenate dehydrogenase/arogenate dehydrogenase family protein [Gammaproteobacteria bacterium]|nr:prephenate dehydrogenase/arogenate dehydrogenase family protein [Gammaproteobacteria bacterium]